MFNLNDIQDDLRCWIRHMPDWWRDVPDDLQVAQSMSTGLGNITPIATNGVLVIGRLDDGRAFVAHKTNLPEEWNKREQARLEKSAKPKASQDRKSKKAKLLLVDASSILDE